MKTFLKEFITIYGTTFVNRRPKAAELSKIEEEYSKKQLSGCVGAFVYLSMSLAAGGNMLRR